jgi:hypothetical protein
MDLLHLNNAQGLASMLFLMAGDPESPVIGQAEALERAWRQHLADGGARPPDLMAVTWVANAQMTFPLAWWLAVELMD